MSPGDRPLRAVCLHGHFYQPPRENPWLEAVEVEDGAAPFHDWNARITAECYGPNSASRILDGQNRIRAITNNFDGISFDVGPTLLSWMATHAPEVYAAILEADRVSREARGGHGNALAHPYTHAILPLDSRRDKVTQVRWGMADFRRRFGRDSEGMWLPETAVDPETLEVLAEHGIAFTVLSPRQAARVRALGGGEWRDVRQGGLDVTQPYRVRLPGSRSLAVFFYNEPVSRAIAFEGLLGSGEALASRLLGAFVSDRPEAQLVHVATDGESYGHHHRFGDMALAYALDVIRKGGQVRLTNYGEFLERHPPAMEVEVLPNTTWSCPHGIERWRSDCGCQTGQRPGWHQRWRGPLREALDWLRDALDVLYEEKAAALLRDPWAARDEYIQVILDRSREQVEAFLSRHAKRALSPSEGVEARMLLELQRHGLLMYTSCGWFFDEVSGLETVLVLKHAARALHLSRHFTREPLEDGFLRILSRAESNRPDVKDGATVYRRLVRPALVDLRRVIAHYAVSSLFAEYPQETRIYAFTCRARDIRRQTDGAATLAVGQVRAASEVTGESEDAAFAVLYRGGADVSCALRGSLDGKGLEHVRQDLFAAFGRHSIPEVVRALEQHFGSPSYSLRDVFPEERRRILALLTAGPGGELTEASRRLSEGSLRQLDFFGEADARPLEFSKVLARAVLQEELEQETARLVGGLGDAARLRGVLQRAERLEVALDLTPLQRALAEAVAGWIRAVRAGGKEDLVRRATVLLEVAESPGLPLDLWEAQNRFHRAVTAPGPTQDGQERLLALGRSLGFSEQYLAALQPPAVRQGASKEAGGGTV
jgi:alpha-amylase/alpha-mannosidase (GH57 family)